MEHYFSPILTPRLILRCPESADSGALSRLITPDVARWVASWAYPFTRAMAEERIANARARAADHTAVPRVIIRKDDGELMGWVGLVMVAPRRGAFGYWLGDDFQGVGYMREAAPPALAAGFKLLDVDVIEAAAQLDNAASIAILKACGMTYVDERMIFAPSRQVEDRCAFYEAVR